MPFDRTIVCFGVPSVWLNKDHDSYEISNPQISKTLKRLYDEGPRQGKPVRARVLLHGGLSRSSVRQAKVARTDGCAFRAEAPYYTWKADYISSKARMEGEKSEWFCFLYFWL